MLTETSRHLRALSAKLGWVRARVAFGKATSRLRILPGWILIGAQRSGTSSIYEYLVAHPLVGRAATEETHYFDNNYHRGLDWYRGHFPTRLRSQFAHLGHAQKLITGESTPYYLPHPFAAQRIARDLPGVKIIVALRNPVDRAYSHFHHERALGREPLASFEQALDHEPQRLQGELERMLADPAYYSFALQNFSYVTRGRYAGQLDRLFKLFPREQVLVLHSERMLKEPAAVYAQVLHFVGLPPHTLKRFPRHSARHYPAMAPSTRARLQSLFAPENERLFTLLGADFGWNQNRSD